MIAFRPQEKPMIVFQVNDMTCGRSAGVITKAVAGVDHAAKVRINLVIRRVEIEPNRADADELRDAINKAGFTPEAFENSARDTVPWSDCRGSAVAGLAQREIQGALPKAGSDSAPSRGLQRSGK